MPSSTPHFRTPFEFDMVLLEPIHAMMHKGIRVDQKKKKALQDQALAQWDQWQAELDSIAGCPVNAEGSKILQALLHDELKIKRRTKNKKTTTDETALRSIMAECLFNIQKLGKSDPRSTRWIEGLLISTLVLKIRGQRKKISSFLGLSIKKGKLDGPIPFEDTDGRIRSTISVGGTETARFSHSKTLWDTGINLATVPHELRGMFIPDKGFEFAEFDLNRGESWIYAHLSEDPELIRIHTNDLDFHAETGATISVAFGFDDLTVEWIIENKKTGKGYMIRYVGKRVNHASAYRMGPYLGTEIVNQEAEETGVTCTVAQFKEAQRLWHERYFMVKSNWWAEIERTLDRTRTMVTPYGRIHQFHDAWGEHLFKAATAYVPQSTSVDYLNRGLLRVYHDLQTSGLADLSLLAQTHDSILVQYREGYRDEVLPLIQEKLLSRLEIKKREFFIPVEASYGTSWADEDMKAFKLPKLQLVA